MCARVCCSCPPEAYFGKPFTDVSDVYSVAVILWELLMRTIKGVFRFVSFHVLCIINAFVVCTRRVLSPVLRVSEHET